MAKIVEEKITFKLSKLVRNDSDEIDLLDETMVASIEAVLQELVGNEIILEIT